MFSLSLFYGAFYRVRQFFRGLFAKITPAEEEEVQRYLSAAEYALFCRMPLDARRHSLNVLQMLIASGKRDSELAVAALLHDVGKVAADESGTKLGLWIRGPIVLLESIWPRAIEQLASASPSDGWRYALHVQLEHPRIGAEWADAAGSSAVTCWLIASHQKKLSQAIEQTSQDKASLDNWALLDNNASLDNEESSISDWRSVYFGARIDLPKNLSALLADLQWADGQN